MSAADQNDISQYSLQNGSYWARIRNKVYALIIQSTIVSYLSWKTSRRISHYIVF